jgi:Arc/MetJ family transcription regulator
VVAQAQKASPAADAVAAAGVSEPEYIEITDDMSPDEVRKARISNARARSAYMKALKAAGVDPSQVTERAEQPAAAPAATEESAKAATPAEPTPASGREAVAVPADVGQPDYIEITDDMSADEVRKARVANARERSRFYKALKERGIDPKEWEAQQEQGAPAPSQAQAAEVAAKAEAQEAPAAPAEQAEAPAASGGTVQIPPNIARPDYIEITDDMPADEVRRARVHNAKERSAFYKALKAAGIDPKEVAEGG